MSVATTSISRSTAPLSETSRDWCLNIPRERYYRLSVEQYHQMIAAGIFHSDDRVELLEGLLVKKMTRNAPHDNTIMKVTRRLIRLLPDEWILGVQTAVTLSDSEPEPDFSVVRGPESAYAQQKPKARDTVLLIEVAESSLQEDRIGMGSLYAAAKVPEYWIINLVERKIEVYSKPRAGKNPGYRERVDFSGQDEVSLVLDGIEIGRIQAADLLP